MDSIPRTEDRALPRIIRAATGSVGRAAAAPMELNLEDVQRLAERILREAREKVGFLQVEAGALEACLEARRAEVEKGAADLRATAEREVSREREALQAEAEALRKSSVEKGLAEGRAEGVAGGREEGYRKGFEEGYREGREAGYREGREAEISRIRAETEPLGKALSSVLREIGERRSTLLRSVREELLPLALAIAKKVIKREVRECPEVVLRNVRKAIDLSFRRTALVVQVHPEDVALVEKYAPEIAGSFAGLTEVTVRPAEDVSRGGCRVVSSSGVVDLRVEAQLELIEQALFKAIGEGDPAQETAAGADPARQGAPLEEVEEKSGEAVR